MTDNDKILNPASRADAAVSPPPSPAPVWLGRVLRTVLLAAILAGGFLVARYWMKNRPTAERRKPTREARYVEVMPLEMHDRNVVVEAMGTVKPVREVNLTAEVSGKIVAVSPDLVPGGFFPAGTVVAEIEKTDYELALRQRASELARAEAELTREMGQQAVARRELEMLGQELTDEDRRLVLREPQLQIAQANLASAKAALEAARLDLARTGVRAPFNAMVRERYIELSSQVAPGTQLASLVGTDAYWIEITVPVDELHWVQIPGFNAAVGSPVRIFCAASWGADAHRIGRVYRLLTGLEPQGRMARLLIALEDPLQMNLAATEKRQPLLLNSYVRTEIEGMQVEDVIRIPRQAMHDNSRIWIMTDENTLDIREVSSVWTDAEYVYARDSLTGSERLIISNIATPVQGMALRADGTPVSAGQSRSDPDESDLEKPAGQSRSDLDESDLEKPAGQSRSDLDESDLEKPAGQSRSDLDESDLEKPVGAK
jgi:RND family efflux transporter MFP subunit